MIITDRGVRKDRLGLPLLNEFLQRLPQPGHPFPDAVVRRVGVIHPQRIFPSAGGEERGAGNESHFVFNSRGKDLCRVHILMERNP